MSIEQNKAIARQFFEDAYNTGNTALLEQLLAPTYVDQKAPTGTPEGPQGIAEIITMFRSAFPDLHFKIEDQIAEGDKVVTRYTFSGTQQGELMGIPPTGKHVSISGISIYRITDGKMQQAWIEYDMLGMLQQLGIVPSMG
ncbi:MAG TPA: ester cyclase [Ktedonobacteraceae bacterium]|nr:ester cyclase [Ktedonobacteraceae bacterium]